MNEHTTTWFNRLLHELDAFADVGPELFGAGVLRTEFEGLTGLGWQRIQRGRLGDSEEQQCECHCQRQTCTDISYRDLDGDDSLVQVRGRRDVAPHTQYMSDTEFY